MSVQSKQVKLWLAQRISAGVLAVCVVIHLITIFYAMRAGLTAVEILGRTRGNLVFAMFYFVFVLSAAIHAPIGVARIAQEWFSWRGKTLNIACVGLGALMLITGLLAVWGVYAPQ
jgi:fumarate reductase subunit C